MLGTVSAGAVGPQCGGVTPAYRSDSVLGSGATLWLARLQGSVIGAIAGLFLCLVGIKIDLAHPPPVLAVVRMRAYRRR